MHHKKLFVSLIFVVRLFLSLAIMYWGMLTVLLVGPFFTHGMRGVEGKLMHLALEGQPFEYGAEKVVIQVHKMWETQFLMLSLTWLIASVHRSLNGKLRRSNT